MLTSCQERRTSATACAAKLSAVSATDGMSPAAGVPETGAVQEILHWQATTVRMMYSMIAAAIQAKGAPASPLAQRSRLHVALPQ